MRIFNRAITQPSKDVASIPPSVQREAISAMQEGNSKAARKLLLPTARASRAGARELFRLCNCYDQSLASYFADFLDPEKTKQDKKHDQERAAKQLDEYRASHPAPSNWLPFAVGRTL